MCQDLNYDVKQVCAGYLALTEGNAGVGIGFGQILKRVLQVNWHLGGGTDYTKK